MAGLILFSSPGVRWLSNDVRVCCCRSSKWNNIFWNWSNHNMFQTWTWTWNWLWLCMETEDKNLKKCPDILEEEHMLSFPSWDVELLEFLVFSRFTKPLWTICFWYSPLNRKSEGGEYWANLEIRNTISANLEIRNMILINLPNLANLEIRNKILVIWPFKPIWKFEEEKNWQLAYLSQSGN